MEEEFTKEDERLSVWKPVAFLLILVFLAGLFIGHYVWKRYQVTEIPCRELQATINGQEIPVAPGWVLLMCDEEILNPKKTKQI